MTYLWVLLVVAALGAGATAVAEVWVTHAQREREAELLFVGEQYRQAIGAYFEATPGAARQYPRSLEDLLRDRRSPVVRRYLRRLYADPMTGSIDWGIVKAPDGGIAGIYTKSKRATYRKKGFKPEHAAFEDAQVYADWKFVYVAGDTGTTGAPPRTPVARSESGMNANGPPPEYPVMGPTFPYPNSKLLAPADARPEATKPALASGS